MIRFFLASTAVLFAFSCAPAKSGVAPASSGSTARPSKEAHAWKVYDGEQLILDVNDTPGTLLSTASLPPGATPVRHPFLSASAHSASHEDRLRRLLEASNDVSDFLRRLEAAGYAVKPQAAND